MYKELKKILNNAYAPYSHFHVGAIVVTDKGKFSGVNVENASYGLTVCAERNAIFSAVSHGAKKFHELHLFANTKTPCFPCGACLQVMSEFFDPKHTKIITYTSNGKKTLFFLNDLLKKQFDNVKHTS
ncbi:MAG: cytidine deaminase [Mycoplasmataceae bacterium]|jgi:cytidine deaminase|nr:cytidine deaminase [Mycoplasmataceae bacterium]